MKNEIKAKAKNFAIRIETYLSIIGITAMLLDMIASIFGNGYSCVIPYNLYRMLSRLTDYFQFR